jgi:hypothetical protein
MLQQQLARCDVNPIDAGFPALCGGPKDPGAHTAHVTTVGKSCSEGAEASIPTLFHEIWWLEAASRGIIDSVSVTRDGICVANLFFVRLNTFGVRQIRMPPYTRVLGPTFALPPSKPSTRLMNVRRLVGELIGKLPPHDRLLLTLPPASESAFAFSLAGYALEPNYTFRVAQTVPLSDLWHGMDQKTRNVIRTAMRKSSVSRHYDIDRFKRLSLLQHPGNLNDFESLERIFSACAARNRTVILTAQDENGRDAASAILVWGAGTAYYLLSARNPAIATSGSNSLLIWAAMEFAKELNVIFDFDGYGNSGGGLFLEKFGLVPEARQTVLFANTRGRLLELARGALDEVVHRGSRTGHWSARWAARAASTLIEVGRHREI